MDLVKISALPAVPSAQLTDIFPVVQSGVTYKETISQLSTLLNSSLNFVPIAGGTMSGPLILSGDPILPLGAATKEYVDMFAAGITVILSCAAATTPAGGDLGGTYNNGVAGVGATLTNAGAMAAFAVDGYSANLNDRILVKNQTAPEENGIYEVTDVGSGATNWVLTRTTDYDEAPSEIKPGTLVAVNNGTVNATTSWLETATVTNIGTDPILFSQFTFSPSDFLLKANNLSDLSSVAAALVNLGLGVPTGTGNVVLQTSPTLITPNLGVATATSLQFSPTTNGIIGTTTNDDAIAGRVGEFVSSNIPAGSAIALVNNIAKNITSLNLTAGDWDVTGTIITVPGAGTQSSAVRVSISNVSNTTATPSPNNGFAGFDNMPANPSQVWVLSTGNCRKSLSGPTTIYLVAQCAFTVNTLSAYGWISARRVR